MKLIALLSLLAVSASGQIVVINASDAVSASRAVINSNFAYLDGKTSVSATYQITDLLGVRTSGTVLTIGAGCGVSTPCNIRFGDAVVPITASATATLSSTPSGLAYVEVTRLGAINVGVPGGFTTVTCSGCTAVTSTAFSTDSSTASQFTWQATSGVWAATGTSARALQGIGKQIVPGNANITTTEDAGHVYISGAGAGTSIQQTSYRPCAGQIGTGTVVADGVSFDGALPSPSSTGPCQAVLASAGGKYVIFYHELPATWTGSAVTANVRWSQNSGGSGNVQMNIDSYCANATNVLGTPSYTTVSVTASVPTSDTIKTTVFTPSITGCTAPSTMYLKVYNTASGSGGTTYTSPVTLIALTVSDVH